MGMLGNNLGNVRTIVLMGLIDLFVFLDGGLELLLLLLCGTIHMDGNRLAELGVDVLKGAPLATKALVAAE
jgi:hypothetical protein